MTAKVSNMSYYEYITKSIFKPLNMTRTNIDHSDTFGLFEDTDVMLVDKSLYYSAGAIVSSFEDMIEFGKAIQ